jgi:preprotein translocase subunit SecG
MLGREARARRLIWGLPPPETSEFTRKGVTVHYLAYALEGVLLITSVLLMLVILLHRGTGGGMSELFGGGVSSKFGGSSTAERNLDRITVFVAIIWAACIVGLGLMVGKY